MNYIFNAKIKSNSPNFKLCKFSQTIIINTKNQPENNKANLEILKELKKLFNREIKILRGLRSKNKVILIKDLTENQFDSKISS